MLLCWINREVVGCSSGHPVHILQQSTARQPRACLTDWPRLSSHLQAATAVAQQTGTGAHLQLELCCIGPVSAADAALWTQLLSQQGPKPEETSRAVLGMRVSSLAWPSQPHRWSPVGSWGRTRDVR